MNLPEAVAAISKAIVAIERGEKTPPFRGIRTGEGQPAMYDGPVSPLRLEVPDLVWLALKIESAKRKVAVKYLVIEALAAKGYAEGLDIALIPEDGRRNAKR